MKGIKSPGFGNKLFSAIIPSRKTALEIMAIDYLA
jgi:hypothetical protein